MFDKNGLGLKAKPSVKSVKKMNLGPLLDDVKLLPKKYKELYTKWPCSECDKVIRFETYLKLQSCFLFDWIHWFFDFEETGLYLIYSYVQQIRTIKIPEKPFHRMGESF